MRKQLLSITILLSAILASAQTNVDSGIFDKHKAEKLIIGKWKGVNISPTCDDLTGFNEMMNIPVAKNRYKALANALNFEYRQDKKFISGDTTITDTIKYEISGIGVDLFGKNKEKIAVKKQYKIISIINDTLIYSEEVKTSNPAGIFSSENSGQSWTKVDNIFAEEGSDHVICVASTNIGIIAFANSILYLSRDNGVLDFKKSK